MGDTENSDLFATKPSSQVGASKPIREQSGRTVPASLKSHGTVRKQVLNVDGTQPTAEMKATAEALDDGMFPTNSQTQQRNYSRSQDGVEYSLNKKNRWNLENKIKDDIENCNVKEGTSLSLVEKETFASEQQRTKAFHIAKDGTTSHRHGRSTFSNLDTLEAIGRRTPDRNADGEEIPEEPRLELRYEVSKGSKSQKLYQKSCNSLSKHNYQSRVHRPGVRAEMDAGDYADEDYEDAYDDDVEHYDTPHEGDEIDPELSDYVAPKDTSSSDNNRLDYHLAVAESLASYREEQKKQRKNKDQRQNEDDTSDEPLNKGRIYYIDSLDQLHSEDVSIPGVDDFEHLEAGPSSSTGAPISATPSAPRVYKTFFDMNPSSVQIWSSELDSERLAETYGSDYRECAMINRRFTIDISEAVNKEVINGPTDESPQKIDHITALCIIEAKNTHTTVENGRLTDVRVSLNANLNEDTRTLSMNTLNDAVPLTVSDVVAAAIATFGIMPFESFRPLSGTVSLPDKMKVKESADSTVHPPRTAYSQDGAVSALLEVNNHIRKLQRQLTAVRVHAGGDDNDTSLPFDPFEIEQFCGICYKDLSGTEEEATEGPSSSEDPSPCALAQCQHWFCADCWKSYLVERIYDGRVPIGCPEYRCNAFVDLDTLKAMLPLPLCDLYGRKLRDLLILKSGQAWSWCPNQACGRVVHSEIEEGREILMLSCYCGYTWCPKCLGAPHWPVECELANVYMEKLKKNGNIVAPRSASSQNDIKAVNVRACPICKTLLERRGGQCTYYNVVRCICGHRFCFNCLRPYTFANQYEHTKCMLWPKLSKRGTQVRS